MLTAQPLILNNTLLVPSEFADGKVFRELSWGITWIKRGFEENEERRIVLRFNGSGGETSDLYACVDLLRVESEDGTRIEGYLYGSSFSAHSTLWAACPHRYVLPHGAIEIHSTRQYVYNHMLSPADLEGAAATVARENRRAAQILAAACGEKKYDVAYWLNVFEQYPADTFLHLGAKELVETYQMCDLYGGAE